MSQTETTACPHGIRAPVVCPECEPAAYERARPQAERMAARRAALDALVAEGQERGEYGWP